VALLEVRGLVKSFVRRQGWRGPATTVRAVDGVSFALEPGEIFALVGESGSGKSTTARCVLRLVEPTAGKIMFQDRDLLALRSDELRRTRRHIQAVFQDPDGSLNPRLRVGEIVAEPLVVHRIGSKEERRRRVGELLRLVGLEPSAADRFPRMFSAGQRQRISIARALALEPSLLVADEPVSALDAPLQVQIVELIRDLQRRLGLSCLFITHDLRLVRRIAARAAVMRLGRIVELAPPSLLFDSPRHPYTRALVAALPWPESKDPWRLDTTRTRARPADSAPADQAAELREVGPGHWARV
jgi:ABC-type oligopeptide transport system ATPase subunit